MNAPLAYNHQQGKSPGVQGNKALMLEAYCKTSGHQFTRFDYSGHGDSPGLFEEGSITQWRDDALWILDNVCHGPQILVGSSMGAWLATLIALERPERLHALIGIAAAPDLTEELLLPALSAAQLQALQAGETLQLDNDYEDIDPHRIRQQLIDTGRKHLVLNRSLAVHCPVRLLHGMADADVSWTFSQRLLTQLESQNAQLTLVSGANHRFSTDSEMLLIKNTLAELLAL